MTMAQRDTESLRVAREIVAGSRQLSFADLMDLAYRLREENHVGYARRVYAVAVSMAPADCRSQAQIKFALATYKDPDLAVDDRANQAESILLDVLARSGLITAERQEALGMLGGIHKLRFTVFGPKSHLEKSAACYRAGYELGVASDFGYTALNTAFVLDLLGGDDHGEASRIR